jgi:hypothetical protein
MLLKGQSGWVAAVARRACSDEFFEAIFAGVGDFACSTCVVI